MNGRAWLLFLLLLTIFVILIWYSIGRPPSDSRPPIVLWDPAGNETTEFQLHDSLVFNANYLEPRTGYTIRIVRDDDEVVVENRLSTDAAGSIPPTVLWYAIGLRRCWQDSMLSISERPLAYARIADASYAGRSYTLDIAHEGQIVRSVEFQVAAELTRPTLYTADSRGCPKTGFLIGEDDVWVIGRNFPEGSLLRVWAVPADSDWSDGEPLRDQTSLYGYELPPLLELGSGNTSFARLLWPKHLTSVGSYDIVAEVVDYSFGTYRDLPSAKANNVVASRSHSGFVIQRRPGVAEPLEMDIAGSTQSPFTFRSSFLTTENVYVGVDPAVQPGFVGQTADVYIVEHKTDAQWTTDQSLNDKTGFVETLTVNGICGNCWKTLAWSAPLVVGNYDVVLDFNQDGSYTPGTDLIDSLDPVGFTVSEVRVDSISFDYPGAGAVTLYDDLASTNVTGPEFLSAGNVIKPAAWVMGGTHSVRVNFAAVPSINQAGVWAEGGLGGLNGSGSPITITFSGGAGQGDFTVNSPPSMVTKTTFSWNWKYKVGTGTADMGQTGEHVLYTLLATPQAPQAIPWVATLDVASQAASGATTAAAATRSIWQEFYYNAGGLYDTVSGESQYTGAKTASFNLTSWLSNYAGGSIGTVNCYDMGKSVVVFANALGSSTEYTYTGPFGYLNLVKPIGKGWTNNPFYDNSFCDPNPVVNGDWDSSQGRCGFANHGFTRLAGQIYDGSGGQVDTDSDPDGLPASIPRELDGDDSWPNLYQDRVIDDVPVSNPGAPTVYAFTVY